jgi:2-C-methyl-D-erythritol 4-phosphate cytidylyltransferase / 2-C-methyl-D-erythritol 2,4-cyclodiphosphate synthase
VLIPAAGSGSRFLKPEGGPRNKVLAPLAGEPALRHTVRAFHALPTVATVRIIAHPEDRAALDEAFADRSAWTKLGPWIVGGAERQDSVRLGLEALEADGGEKPDWVLVHDGARPLCSPALIHRVLTALQSHSAVVPVVPVFDTVRKAGPQATSGGVMDRTQLRLTQTPQGFHTPILVQAHRRAQADGAQATDDGHLIERMGLALHLVAGERRNIKVTIAGDLALAEWIAAHPEWGTEALLP